MNIKPLSVNQAWKGRRYKTAAYIKYERDLMLLLPAMDVPENGGLSLGVEVGFSSHGSDTDNVLKPFLDVLSKVYGFNDNRIQKIVIAKVKVDKKSEYIEFHLEAV